MNLLAVEELATSQEVKQLRYILPWRGYGGGDGSSAALSFSTATLFVPLLTIVLLFQLIKPAAMYRIDGKNQTTYIQLKYKVSSYVLHTLNLKVIISQVMSCKDKNNYSSLEITPIRLQKPQLRFVPPFFTFRRQHQVHLFESLCTMKRRQRREAGGKTSFLQRNDRCNDEASLIHTKRHYVQQPRTTASRASSLVNGAPQQFYGGSRHIPLPLPVGFVRHAVRATAEDHFSSEVILFCLPTKYCNYVQTTLHAVPNNQTNLLICDC